MSFSTTSRYCVMRYTCYNIIFINRQNMLDRFVIELHLPK